MPIGVVVSVGDVQSIRRFGERDHPNIIRWSEFDHGGHDAAYQAPDFLIGELGALFRSVR